VNEDKGATTHVRSFSDTKTGTTESVCPAARTAKADSHCSLQVLELETGAVMLVAPLSA
jgi:hypothetical protein